MQTNRKRKISALAYPLFFLLLFGVCVFHMEELSRGVTAGLSLSVQAVIPTVFPFLIFTDILLSLPLTNCLLTHLSRPLSYLFRLSPESGSAFLIGNIFGFPMGAKAVAYYYKSGVIAKKEAERLLLFVGNASPFFLIGSVGVGMLGSRSAGIRLYLIQLSVSFFCALFTSIGKKKAMVAPAFSPKEPTRDASLPATIRAAVRSSLFICGYIVFFSAIAAVLLPSIKSVFLSCILTALLEIGNGSFYAAQAGGGLALSFSAFAASFAGLSVYLQTLDAISDTDLRTTYYLPVKLLCGGAAFFFALLLK